MKIPLLVVLVMAFMVARADAAAAPLQPTRCAVVDVIADIGYVYSQKTSTIKVLRYRDHGVGHMEWLPSRKAWPRFARRLVTQGQGPGLRTGCVA
jgi:hypothetical protein